MVEKLTPRLIFQLTIPPFMWACNAIVGRMLVGLVPPLMLNFMRWALVLLVLLFLGRHVLNTAAKRQALWQRRWPLAVLGLMGVGAYNALQYVALNTSSPLNVTLIAASSPVWMLLVGWAFYGIIPRGMQLLGALFSIWGVVMVLTQGHISSAAQMQFVQGDLFMLAAAISWAFYSWILASPPPAIQQTLPRVGEDWAGFLLVQTLFGVIWAGMAASAEWVWLGQKSTQWSVGVVAAIVFIAIGPSLLAYRYWGEGVAKVGPTIAAFFSNLTPLFAALLQTTLLHKPPEWHHAVAFALIVLGIVVSAWRR